METGSCSEVKPKMLGAHLRYRSFPELPCKRHPWRSCSEEGLAIGKL